MNVQLLILVLCFLVTVPKWKGWAKEIREGLRNDPNAMEYQIALAVALPFSPLLILVLFFWWADSAGKDLSGSVKNTVLTVVVLLAVIVFTAGLLWMKRRFPSVAKTSESDAIDP